MVTFCFIHRKDEAMLSCLCERHNLGRNWSRTELYEQVLKKARWDPESKRSDCPSNTMDGGMCKHRGKLVELMMYMC